MCRVDVLWFTAHYRLNLFQEKTPRDDGQPCNERAGEIIAAALRESGLPERRWGEPQITKLWRMWVAGLIDRTQFVQRAAEQRWAASESPRRH
jgi:hypothetical protein